LSTNPVVAKAVEPMALVDAVKTQLATARTTAGCEFTHAA